ncbi:hypothetical protein [Streptomyces sp. MMG1121]|uniref:hypothetical protein n=1 Tax=Streptomyces sp. MMG1121 TaxID=1415544 RepID=UPI0006AF01F3|nr:hypothetical protein [Streptomyces sp. MMG1121]KOV63333.1 hypothetical protein ADK64_21665 [Streptomyces sp. MMG1121]
MRARPAVLPGVALLVALTAGCAHHDGASPKTPAATGAPSGTPSGYAQMKQKVDAAQSAAAAADRDATSDVDK